MADWSSPSFTPDFQNVDWRTFLNTRVSSELSFQNSILELLTTCLLKVNQVRVQTSVKKGTLGSECSSEQVLSVLTSVFCTGLNLSVRTIEHKAQSLSFSNGVRGNP